MIIRIRLGSLVCLMLAALLHTACAPTSSGGGDSGDNEGDTDGQVASDLHVDNFTWHYFEYNGWPTPILVAFVTLRNTSDSPVSLQPALFSIATVDGLVYAGDPISTYLDSPCPTDAMLDVGAEISCDVGFRLNNVGEIGVSVSYNGGTGFVAEAPLSGWPAPGAVCQALWEIDLDAPTRDRPTILSLEFRRDDSSDAECGVVIEDETEFPLLGYVIAGESDRDLPDLMTDNFQLAEHYGPFARVLNANTDGNTFEVIVCSYEDYTVSDGDFVAVQVHDGDRRSNAMCVSLAE